MSATIKMFPIQSERGAKPHPVLIPWSIAELAYSVYAANYGRSQSLERLAERGGFGPGEMDMLLPDWRERCNEILALSTRVLRLESESRVLVGDLWSDIQQWLQFAQHSRNVLPDGHAGRPSEEGVARSKILLDRISQYLQIFTKVNQ